MWFTEGKAGKIGRLELDAPGGGGGGGTGGGGGGGGGAGGGGTPDTTPPVFLSARLTNTTFAVDGNGSPEVPVAARRALKGTTFVYALSEPARVLFTIESRRIGRKVGAACQKQSKRNRGNRSCTRFVRIGAFAQDGIAGENIKKFSGGIGFHTLKPGRYRATLVAKDAAGNTSAVSRLAFKIVRR
jgi:hypothetical protein